MVRNRPCEESSSKIERASVRGECVRACARDYHYYYTTSTSTSTTATTTTTTTPGALARRGCRSRRADRGASRPGVKRADVSAHRAGRRLHVMLSPWDITPSPWDILPSPWDIKQSTAQAGRPPRPGVPQEVGAGAGAFCCCWCYRRTLTLTCQLRAVRVRG